MSLIIFVMTIAGLAMFLMSWLPRAIHTSVLSLPIVYVGLGAVLYLVPYNTLFGFDLPAPDPLEHPFLTEHITEVAVILSLTGAGLRLNRDPNFRNWATAIRLLAIAMPLCIGMIALLGWGVAGLALPTAVLLGAVLAPTDPVLADDVQVNGPQGEQDEVRFSLTLEAGLNDGLAFPFTYLAMVLVAITAGTLSAANGLTDWLLVDVFYRIIVGVVAGAIIGGLLARFIFRFSADNIVADRNEGLVAIAITLIAYGLTEIVHGYGFLAVFVAAVVIRQYERDHEYHERLHVFVEQIERMLLVLLMILLGGAVVTGLLAVLTWQSVLVALVIILLVRPVAGYLSLLGRDVPREKRLIIAFFGIRGVGSFYYLAYALNKADFQQAEAIWALVALVVLFSIFIHGLTVTPIMRWLDRRIGG